jgi:antitoxin component YwqK of YwqJK toxin-antitoxin module
MNEADDYLKMMHEATAMRGSELESKFKTMLFSYRNALGMLFGLKNELDEVVNHIDNLDIETISNFYKPVLDKANDLGIKIENLDDDIRYHTDMKEYLSSIKSHNIDTWVRKLDETINAIQNRVEKTYHQNGQLETITPYVNGKQHGIFQRYYENGKLRYETPYVNGKLHGIETWYIDRDGECQLLHEISYVNGEKEFQKEYMFSDDRKSYTMIPYVNGKKHGTAISYWGDGTFRGEKFYNNGVNYGTSKFYHKNGTLYCVEPYVNGELHGIRKFYNDDGTVEKELIYENGKIYNQKGYYSSGTLIDFLQNSTCDPHPPIKINQATNKIYS